MKDVLFGIKNLQAYKQITGNLSDGPVAVHGVSQIHRAHLISALAHNRDVPTLIITHDEASAKKMQQDLISFLGSDVEFLPFRDFTFYNIDGYSRSWEHSRIHVFNRCIDKNSVVVAPISAVLMKCIPPEILRIARFSINAGEVYDIAIICKRLIRSGYSRTNQVEGEGQFSIRGGILDIFPIGSALPVRIEFFGDEIDTMAYFDVETQRRTDNIDEIICLPSSEVLPDIYDNECGGVIEQLNSILKNKMMKHPDLEKNIRADIEMLRNRGIFPAIDRYINYIYESGATAIDYFSNDSIVVISDSQRVFEAATGFLDRLSADISLLVERGILHGEYCNFATDFETFKDIICQKHFVVMDSFLNNSCNIKFKKVVNITAKELTPYGSNLDIMLANVKDYINREYRVIISCFGDRKVEYIREYLRSSGIFNVITDQMPEHSRISVYNSNFVCGFEYPDLRVCVISEGEISRFKKKSSRKKTGNERVKSYSDLIPGDIVVHEHHGICRFAGIECMNVDDVSCDFIKLAFKGTDVLYVPATNLDIISKYIGKGSTDNNIKLNKLGGIEWAKTKIKAKDSAKALAAGLIQLYSERNNLAGFSFSEDDDVQRDFEAKFPHDETDDQLRCAEEIKLDMQSERPMDRLLCGDVGFGKTEVAIRAIMKCIVNGKQAAVLVPTTVLARQHYLSFVERFKGYPINIDMLSRFRNKREETAIKENIKGGNIDIIIGTHKLFAGELAFKDLGLLVIDEEQRFGVAHKEKLKEKFKNIDVLVLTATPIPRTLNMALSGIRDMSVLEEAPKDRYPVETYVLEYNFLVICDAIRRELNRGGQVYYVYNRIENIEGITGKLKRELPDANIAVAHGKMNQSQLSNIMLDLSEGVIDILVCTTIIETGIDIPNVNTLIIENADKMGLSQLHQIRGRVGRSNKHSFAYFTFKSGKVLSEVSQQRLSAIREFAEFGSGFKIAMRDLEIRGAGNVLGAEQSGHLMSVGYDLYLKLLEEAVLEEKGETVTKRTECLVDLNINANIPSSYIDDMGQRIDMYRRIAMIRSDSDNEDIIDELIDRFGDIPKPVINLCKIALMRARASSIGIVEITCKDGRIVLKWDEPDFNRISSLCSIETLRGRIMLNAGSKPYVAMRLNANEKPLDIINLIISNF